MNTTSAGLLLILVIYIAYPNCLAIKIKYDYQYLITLQYRGYLYVIRLQYRCDRSILCIGQLEPRTMRLLAAY